MRQAGEHHQEQHLGQHHHHAHEQGVRRVRHGQVAHDGQAHGGGVDAEQRACAFGDLVLHVAVRHQAQKHDVAGESEPEQQMAHCLHAERRRGDGRYDDAHVADEVGWKHLMQFEVRDEASGEPAHQREVRHNGRRP